MVSEGVTMFGATQSPTHIPVMVPEVLSCLDVQCGGRYIDATCGEGGHSQSILKAAGVGGSVLGVDADLEAVNVATQRLASFGKNFICVNDNFRNLLQIASEHNFIPAHGVLFDLGLSTRQLDVEERGFSFQRDHPLDMRFSINQTITAADIVNHYSQKDLADIIFKWGEEPQARKIAAAIVAKRPVKSSGELTNIVKHATRWGNRRIHPATRTFQAIRIAVNSELSSLSDALHATITILGLGGRLVVISYHSLEDRIVKQFIKEQSVRCICPPRLPECVCNHQPKLKPLSRNVITPTDSEIKYNPRARSAKIRYAERI